MRTIWLIAIALLLGPMFAQATSGDEDFVYDPQTDTYIFTFWGHETGAPVFERWIFVPHTRIVPTVRSKIKETAAGTLRYEYRIKNGKDSKQNLESLRFVASHASIQSQTTPKGWRGSIVPKNVSSEFRVNWSFSEGGYGAGLMPGKSQDGFGYDSTDLPGITEAKLEGAAVPVKSETPASSLPNPDSEATRKLEEFKAKDYVPRFVAASKIPNPQPFDAAAVLTSLQKHVKEDIVNMKLIDPVFAAQIDRGLQAALDAAKRGNTAGLRGQLKELRLMLKGFGEPEEADHSNAKDDIPEDQINTKAWPHPIAKLAARVIDFDLQYIERRVKE